MEKRITKVKERKKEKRRKYRRKKKKGKEGRREMIDNNKREREIGEG